MKTRKSYYKNHKLIVAIFVAIILTSCYQIDIEVTGVPANTPKGSVIFVTGNFNKWDPGDSRYSLVLGKDSIYRVSLPVGFGTLEYKFTRGDWTTVETDQCGDLLYNRMYNKTESVLLREKIACWNDMGPIDCPRITIVLDKLPASTAIDDTIYLASNYNNWNAGNPDYKFTRGQQGDPRYMLTLFQGKEDLVFKFTRGTWDKVEVKEDGTDVENHILKFGRLDTAYYHVEEWADLINRTWMDLTFIIQKVPRNTPNEDNLYIVGDFNDWNPRDISMILDKNKDGTYSISIPYIQDYIEYKFTRGGWNTVEGDIEGEDIENRKLNTKPGDTTYIEIESWMDKRLRWR
ncbi:MAG: hypothetical protein K9H64_18075 [Bacteroidales bacterium]|nr:hypothetical protein [Bacteroidales bacterium]MCF8457902.1 hypothetical protein [Bacteroidales bacterium]